MNDIKHYKEIFQMCQDAQKEGMGKIKVGAVCHGQQLVDGEIVNRYWSGANLHITDSFADMHAEQLAVNLALLERFYPTEIYVTSQTMEEMVKLCGSCRQYLNEINRNMTVIVFNPDGTRKSTDLLSVIYKFAKDTTIKNNKLKKMCIISSEGN